MNILGIGNLLPRVAKPSAWNSDLEPKPASPALHAGAPPADSVETSRAVDDTGQIEQLLLGRRDDMQQDRISPSLTTMLDAIRAHIEECVARAQEQDREFFQQLEAFTARLEHMRGADNIKALGQMVGALEPGAKKDFSDAVRKLADAHGASPDAKDGSAAGVELKEFRLAIDRPDQADLQVRLDAFRLEAVSKTADGQDVRSTVSAESSHAQLKIRSA